MEQDALQTAQVVQSPDPDAGPALPPEQPLPSLPVVNCHLTNDFLEALQQSLVKDGVLSDVRAALKEDQDTTMQVVRSEVSRVVREEHSRLLHEVLAANQIAGWAMGIAVFTAVLLIASWIARAMAAKDDTARRSFRE